MKIGIMRPLTMFFVIVCILCVGTTAHAQATTKTLSGFQLITQLMDYWCWAATTDMVFKYKGITNKTQCQIAEWWWEYSEGVDHACCPTSSSCDYPLNDASEGEIIWDNYGGLNSEEYIGSFQFWSSDPGVRTVVSTIDENNPFGIMLNNYNNQGIQHAMPVTGYQYYGDHSTPYYMQVYDPMPTEDGGWGIAWKLYAWQMCFLNGWAQTLYIVPGCL
jgi:hypothetical protein